MKTIAERLKFAREAKEWKQVQLATAAGVSPGTIGNIESGTRQAKGSLPQIAEALGISHKWLATGKGEMHIPSVVASITPTDEAGGIVISALHNVGSMGHGSELLEEDVIKGNLTLSLAWVNLHFKPSGPDALRFIHGYGDSMSPTFESGDILLVDTGIRDHRIDGVYVLQAHGRLFIKRVRQRMDGTTEVSSDNAAHKTVDVLNSKSPVDVLGRVVWVWNGAKL